MVSPVQQMTVREFDTWVLQAENRQTHFEFIGGEIVEVVSNPYASEVAIEIAFRIKLYLREAGRKGHVTGADGGYKVDNERYIPDVAYISAEKQAAMPYTQGYNDLAPDLAIEVISPSDKDSEIALKVANYMAVGAVVWVVYPASEEVHVFVAGQSAKRLKADDTLSGGDVLPDFLLPIADIFGTE